MRLHWLIKGFKVLMYAALTLVLLGGLVTVLWNWLVPTLFGGPVMNMAEALGLLLLTRLLVGRFRGRHWNGRLLGRWARKSNGELNRFEGTREGCVQSTESTLADTKG